MKKFVLISVLFVAFFATFAQSPQSMSYQAIVRNGDGEVLANQNVSLRISILQGSISGTAVYVETHSVITNQFGLVNLSVGSGTIINGVFANINWADGPYFVKLELDDTGGSNYSDMGTSQLLSVPYSLFSQQTSSIPPGQNSGDMMYWNGSQWVFIAAGQHGQALFLCNGIPTWGGCLPIVTTNITTNITINSALSGGEVVNDGGTPVTARGVCWNTTGNPTIADFYTTDGTGIGIFVSSITGLSANTTYYVKAYATNSVGTTYGTEVSFNTSHDLPVVTTSAISSVTQTTATGGGEVTSDGGAIVTARGVCWNTSGNPTITDYHTSDGTGIGIFTSTITGLSANTTYFVKAYAINSVGISYGGEVIFTTSPAFPIVITFSVSSVTQTTASGGGEVISDGGSAVIERGVCWNTTGNPTIADFYTSNGTGIGTFASSITGLTANTMYFVKAYATNSAGTAYGEEFSFTTSPAFPSVTTTAISSVTQTAATGGGEVTSDGGAIVTARGVCWNTSGSPTIADTHTTDGSGTGTFTSSLTGLIANTQYFVRAYATNSAGTAYGNEIQFTTSAPAFNCGTSTISDYDGNNYNTVQIGNQCWMKENMKTTHFSDGTALVDGTSAGYISSDYTTKYWFVYDNNMTNKATYGLLYTWAAIMNGALSSSSNPSGVQGICSTGWHVPSDNEWKQMEILLGMTQSEADGIGFRGTDQGSQLKSTSGWFSGGNGTNTSGFTALPGGYRWYNGSFDAVSIYGFWWTASASNAANAWYRLLDYNYTKVYRYDDIKSNGFSVRCVKDISTQANLPSVTTGTITAITQTTVTGGGEVTSDGGAAVTARGVCWNTTGNPTITDFFTTDGTGIGIFTSSMTGLTANTMYFVKAYATNSAGTAYGEEISFTTSPSLPTVTTSNISAITQTTATGGGEVTSDGGAAVTARGVCWNISGSPVITDSHTTDGTGTGTFSSSLTGLTANTTYHVRAYATNSVGTSYGDEVTFTTSPSLPSVSTSNISAITQTTATGGGEVTSEGGAAVTARGVCWNTSGNPATTDSHTTDGTGIGTFTSSITGLIANTTYHVRAYATNSVGTAYGSDVTFTTSPSLPTVTTSNISAITQTTATGGGEVTSDGGAAVTARGVCWNTSGSPTIADTHTTDGSGTGTFTSSLTGLIANTQYFVRAYATNSAGTAYGNEIQFTTSAPAFNCGTSTISDFDGNNYNTVQIGNQCWTKENMKTTHFSDGTALVDGTNAGNIYGQYTTKYWFVYDNNISNKATYGLLYNWAAVMNGAASSNNNPSGVQGVCPTGWHVPSDAEWTILTNFLGGESVAGGKLKEAGTAHWFSPNTGATNESGFTALPGGYRDYTNWYSSINMTGYWWSSTEASYTLTWTRFIYSYSAQLYRSNLHKSYSHSVRCIRDN
jgi:uncharacterized protein (TIGR02145 family)